MPPFLTDLDPRGAIKGSRDPLGIQPIWTRFARHIIGNLTNASNNARDFTVLMLGCHFSSKIASEAGPEVELPVFLRWEQLAAYARAEINSDRTFRGVERATKNLASAEVTISEQPVHQILSNQKAYGIWGLYSVPGRASGLIGGYPARLTPAAQVLVDETYLPALGRVRGSTARIVMTHCAAMRTESSRKSEGRPTMQMADPTPFSPGSSGAKGRNASSAGLPSSSDSCRKAQRWPRSLMITT